MRPTSPASLSTIENNSKENGGDVPREDNPTSTAREQIRGLYCPSVAVLVSDDTETVIQKNSLSFVELIRPFFVLNKELVLKDPANVNHIIRSLRVDLRDIRRDGFVVPSLLSNALTRSVDVDDQHDKNNVNHISVGSHELDIAKPDVWYNSFVHSFFHWFHPGEQEFLKTHLACIFAVSSSNEDPMATLAALNQAQHSQQHNSKDGHSFEIPSSCLNPQWFSPNVLKYYVLVHDCCSVSDSTAENLYQNMKIAYGGQVCHLLRINSGGAATVNLTEHWNSVVWNRSLVNVSNNVDSPQQANATPSFHCESIPHAFSSRDLTTPIEGVTSPTSLASSDVERLRVFGQEFITRAFLPYIERQWRILFEQIQSRRRKNLLAVPTKWFGQAATAANPVSASSPLSGDSSAVVYTQESFEMQTRRLADLAFLFQHYESAVAEYKNLKDVFRQENASLYLAGALEMMAMCNFMLPNTTKPFPAHYMDTALNVYLSKVARPMLAVRSCILSTMILKTIASGKHQEAADQYIRMTTAESDLCSAIFLEQAAMCFVETRMVRKFALHVILAGHRFSKAGHKRHALRCYGLAQQIYAQRGWALADDHIAFTMSNHHWSLGQSLASVQCLASIVKNSRTQSEAQHRTLYIDFISRLAECVRTSSLSPLPELDVPILDTTKLITVVSNHSTTTAAAQPNPVIPCDRKQSALWSLLEYVTIQRYGNVDMYSYVPWNTHYTSATDNTHSPRIPTHSTYSVYFSALNRLKIPVILRNVTLLWRFTSQFDNAVVTNDGSTSSAISVTTIDELSLSESSTQICLSLQCNEPGELEILGLLYEILDLPSPETKHSVRAQQPLRLQGRRLNNTKHERTRVVHAADRRLRPLVLPLLPHVTLSHAPLPAVLLCGQFYWLDITLLNDGPLPITSLCVAVDHASHVRVLAPECLASFVTSSPDMSFDDVLAENHVATFRLTDAVMLEPGQSMSVTLALVMPEHTGPFDTHALFYCASEEAAGSVKHRVERLELTTNVQPSVDLAISPLAESSATHSSRLLYVNVSNVCLSSADYCTNLRLRRISCISSNAAVDSSSEASKTCVPAMTSSEACGFCISVNTTLQRVEKAVSSVDFDSSTANDSAALERAFQTSTECGAVGEDADADGNSIGRFDVFWQLTYHTVADGATCATVYGRHCRSVYQRPTEPSDVLRIVRPRDETALKRTVLADLLSYELLCNEIITHDFSGSKLCSWPVCLNLVSRCNTPLRLSVSCDSTADSYGIRWLYSILQCEEVDLPHFGSRASLNLCVAVCLPGIYRLPPLCLTVTNECSFEIGSETNVRVFSA